MYNFCLWLNRTMLLFHVKRFTLCSYIMNFEKKVKLLKSSTEGKNMIIKRKKHKLLMGNFGYVCSETGAKQNYREICLRNTYIIYTLRTLVLINRLKTITSARSLNHSNRVMIKRGGWIKSVGLGRQCRWMERGGSLCR